MKLSKNSSLPTGAPAGFLGKSIFIAGSVNGHSFTYSTTEETELEISGPSAVTPLESKTLLVEIKTATLIKKINLSSITSTTTIDESHRIPTTNPCPAIDSSATDLFTCLRKGFETESNLGRDDNGDYKLDGSEDSVK